MFASVFMGAKVMEGKHLKTEIPPDCGIYIGTSVQ
jgi:hypothetical protein